MSNDFKIFSICLVKNEVDVLGYALAEASRWSDKIFVFDNGSTDGTWETVLAMKNDVITPWKQDGKPFHEHLRGEVFRDTRRLARDGDWWCRLDADEFYVPNPREFLAEVCRPYHVVCGASLEYYLTQADVDTIDFTQPIDRVLNQLTCYKNNVGEPRFFRHRDGLQWPEHGAWPLHMGLVYPRRIPLKHFKYRSPAQMQQRIATRLEAIERGFPGWWAVYRKDGKLPLVDPAECCRDLKDGRLQVDDIPERVYRGKLTRRIVQRVMQGLHIWP